MDENLSAEDRQIKWILITLATGAAATAVVAITTATVLIALNFNVLEWME